MAEEDPKVRGEVDDDAAVGVLGSNTATSGAAVGVKGKTSSPDRYGLYSEDDARVASVLETDGLAIGGNRLYVQATEPTDADEGDVWIDTS